MTPTMIRDEINNLLVYLLENDLALDANSAIIRTNNSNSYVCWATSPKSPLSEIIGRFASLQEYRSIIEKRLYHFILRDGSAFQFGYIFENEIMIQHRLCYYPCPFLIKEEDIGNLYPCDDFISFIDLLLDEESQKVSNFLRAYDFYSGDYAFSLRSPVRCDYSPQIQVQNHSISHMHINHTDSRVPMYGPLPFGQFVKFIFCHFYPAIWEEHDTLRNWPVQKTSYTILEEEKCNLYFNAEFP